MFTILSRTGNRYVVSYYDIEFPVYIDTLAGKLVVKKPRSVYIRDEAHKNLVKIVLTDYHINLDMETSENNDKDINRLR